MTDVTIYHNPACGTSRNALALIRSRGLEPTIVATLRGAALCRPADKVLDLL